MKDVSTTLAFYQKPKSSTEIRDEIKKQIKKISAKKEIKDEKVDEEDIINTFIIAETQSSSFGSKRF